MIGAIRAVLHEIVGLFVDDGALAVMLVACCGISAVLLATSSVTVIGAAALLLGGSIAALLVSVVRGVRQVVARRTGPPGGRTAG
jgi:hypothetical protein